VADIEYIAIHMPEIILFLNIRNHSGTGRIILLNLT